MRHQAAAERCPIDENSAAEKQKSQAMRLAFCRS
jgi:hypothetical protein